MKHHLKASISTVSLILSKSVQSMPDKVKSLLLSRSANICSVAFAHKPSVTACCHEADDNNGIFSTLKGVYCEDPPKLRLVTIVCLSSQFPSLLVVASNNRDILRWNGRFMDHGLNHAINSIRLLPFSL